MAKKKRSSAARVNKSQEIRNHKQSHPSDKPAQIAAALAKKGIDVSPQFVSTVLSTSKKKTVIGKPGRPKKSAATTPRRRNRRVGEAEVSIDSLLRVKQIVTEMGGIDNARRALAALEQLMD